MGDRQVTLGPVQLLIIAFEGGSFEGRILEELRRLREHDVVRMIDLMFVAKDEQGGVIEIEQSDLSAREAAEYGALVGALIGLGAAAPAENGSLLEPESVWFLADAIPAGTAAAIALIEHRWAIPLRAAIEGAGGHDLVDTWVHPEDLIAIGATSSPDLS